MGEIKVSDNAIVSAMLVARSRGVKILASDCEAIIKAVINSDSVNGNDYVIIEDKEVKKIYKLALRNFILYSLEMSLALIGWTYGFGLTVKNWPVLLGTLVVARWLFAVLIGASMLQDIKDKHESKS